MCCQIAWATSNSKRTEIKDFMFHRCIYLWLKVYPSGVLFQENHFLYYFDQLQKKFKIRYEFTLFFLSSTSETTFGTHLIIQDLPIPTCRNCIRVIEERIMHHGVQQDDYPLMVATLDRDDRMDFLLYEKEVPKNQVEHKFPFLHRIVHHRN